MSEIKWVKLSTNIFDNRKIKHLRKRPKGDSIVLFWIMLLTVAGKCNAGGAIFLTENIPYTPKMLASELGFDERIVLLAMKAFEQLDMIKVNGEFFSVVGWEEYQNIDGMEKIKEQNRIRKQKQRERQRLPSDVSRDIPVTVTECHDTEEEEEEEKEEEKEYHSFFHSQKTANEKYVEKKVLESGYEGDDAENYRKEVRENLKMKYLGGELGQHRVFISDEQFEDLCARLSMDEIEKYFSIVAECERAGKRYKKKSHYQAILEMAEHDRMIL